MIVTLTLNPCLDKVLELDRLIPGQELDVRVAVVAAAGKGINVARMARALGEEPLAVWVCAGSTGARVAELLDSEGIRHRRVEVAGETRTAYTIAERASNRATRLFEPGPRLTPADARRIEEEVCALLRPGDVLVLSGSAPSPAGEEAYAALIAWAAAQDIKTVVDTRDAALARSLAAGPYLVKMNQAEAAQATGVEVRGPVEAEGVVRQLRKSAAVALVSLGAAGAVLGTAAGAWFAASPEVRVASPVGSGDAMVGAVVWAMQAGLPAPDWLRWGVAAGAANAASWLPAGCSRGEVAALVPGIQMEQLGQP